MNFKSLIKNVALGTLLRKTKKDDVKSNLENTQETSSEYGAVLSKADETVQWEQDPLGSIQCGEQDILGQSKKDPDPVICVQSASELVKQILEDIADEAVDLSSRETAETLPSSTGSDSNSTKSPVVVGSTGGLKLVPPHALLSKGLLQQALESPQQEVTGSFAKNNSLLASLLVSNSSSEDSSGDSNYVTNHPSASTVTTNHVIQKTKNMNVINFHALGSEQTISDEGALAFYNQVITSTLSKADTNPTPHFKKPLQLAQVRQKSQVLPQARIAPSTPPLCSPTGSDSQEQSAQAQVARNPCQPRHDQTKLLGVFNTKVSTPSLSSKPYIAVVFDKGTLFVPNTDNSGSEWRSKSAQKVGHSFDLKLFRTNPARASYDTVELNLNFAIFTIEKPGSAAKVISDVQLGSCFYLQATAVVRVDTFFIHDKGRRWILSAELVSDICESTNSDILCFLQRSNQIRSESVSEEPELVVPVTRPSVSPNVIIVPKPAKSSNISAPSSSSSSSSGSLSSAPVRAIPTSSFMSSAPNTTASSLLTTVPDVKYPALTVLQSLHCTNCPNCKRKFKYTIEYLFHFVFQKSCQRALVNGKCEKSLFYQKISQAISSKVQVPHQKLVCVKNVGVQKICGFQSKTVLQYCMHNDKHVPDNNEIFPCYFCAGIYFSPFSFYRHKCLVQLKNIENRKSSSLNSLFSIYSAIPLEMQSQILTCPSCSKKYEYVAGLLNHLKKTNSKCLNLLTKCYSKYITKEKYLDVAEMISSETDLELVSLQCEVCLEVVANQVSYCMHKDHHEVGGDSKFVCKECSTQFNSPCSFYRHSCRSPDINWCALCEKVEPSSGFRKKVEEILIEDDEVKVKKELMDPDANNLIRNFTNTEASMNELNDDSLFMNGNGNDLNLGAINEAEQASFPKIISTSGSVQFSPIKPSGSIQFSPTDSESSVDTPRSFTEADVTMDASHDEYSLPESISASNPYINQKKRKNSTERGNIPKKRCNLKKRGISKEFSENFIDTKPIITKCKENQAMKLKEENMETLMVEETQHMSKINPIETKPSPKVEKEIEEKKFEFDYWDCYMCTDCFPLKMLAGAEGLVDHCKTKDDHKDIRPLWTFNQCEVKMNDLKKSYKFGVLVREKEREYLEYKKFGGNVGLLYSTFHKPEALEDVKQSCVEGEVPKLKLKIGKGANGKFSVLS
eukprot:GFUD01042626.1.p1 GENE.GFUD01042626.1~~GFUD01042626.1.p1  ORF type:complete len:1187 (+),score=280.23 GFUD01042626.1:76-3636(+)